MLSKDFLQGFELALGALAAFNLMAIASGVASMMLGGAVCVLRAPGRWFERRGVRKQRAIDAAKLEEEASKQQAIDAAKLEEEAKKRNFRSAYWLKFYLDRIKYGSIDVPPGEIVGSDNYMAPSGT